MAFDVALGVESSDVIANRYELTPTELEAIVALPAFRQELAVHYKTLRESGVTFATKARLIAEEKLEDMYQIISDGHTDSKVRVDAWKAVAEFGGLKPKNDAAAPGGTGNQVNIQIVL